MRAKVAWLRSAILTGSAAIGSLALGQAAIAGSITFIPGDLVISVYGKGAAGDTTTYKDNGASPITLQQLSLSGVTGGVVSHSATATAAGQLVLPQTSGANGQNAISGEFGSSSEGILQQSVNGHDLTIAGYAVNAAAFNSAAASYGGTTKSCIGQGTCYPLAQTPSNTVQRVVALIGANGAVNTSTTLGSTAFSGNNPRSVVTVNGTSFYVSGQGSSKNTGDTTQGVFYATLGAHTSTAIDNSYETRVVSIYGGNLYVSADSTEGSGVHENVSAYNGLPTSAASASILSGIKSKFTVGSAAQLNGLDSTVASGTKIYLSPEQYFVANADTLYIADSGNPKGDNNGKGNAAQGLSDGGLQKWSLVDGTWELDYTLSAGLNLVPDTTACGANSTDCGTTGLIGLTGKVVGGEVELFATNSTLGDLDPTYLYGITDLLSATSLPKGEAFTQLYSAGADQLIRGVAFAPTAAVPEPATWAMMLLGLGGLGVAMRRARRKTCGAVTAS
jgi:hypothetical protein